MPKLKVTLRCKQELSSPGEIDGAEWPAVFKDQYPKPWTYHMKLCFQKRLSLLMRDKAFVRSQIMSALIMGEMC